MAQDIQRLKNGQCIEKEAYIRGVGWGSKILYQPAEYYIAEGLFLDSVEAAEYMCYDRMLALTASDEYIYKLRMERDEYYRQNFRDFIRTKEETIKEIECTLKAGKADQIQKENGVRTEILVQEESCTEVTGE